MAERTLDRASMQQELTRLTSSMDARLATVTQVLSISAVLTAAAASVGFGARNRTVFLVLPPALAILGTYAVQALGDFVAHAATRRRIEAAINTGTTVHALTDHVVNVVRGPSLRHYPSLFVLWVAYVAVGATAVVFGFVEAMRRGTAAVVFYVLATAITSTGVACAIVEFARVPRRVDSRFDEYLGR